MIRLLVLMFALLPLGALAEIYPALHDVTGVAANDVLNVRAQPDASAPIIGSFAPGETGIEVIALSEDRRWGRVNSVERAGWTSMRFLVRQPGQDDADWRVAPGVIAPRTLECFGTEPFWNIVLVPGGTLDYSALGWADGTAEPGRYQAVASWSDPRKRAFHGWLTTSNIEFTGIIKTGLCSDGMSDRDYGMVLDLVVADPPGRRLVAGCCKLVP